MPDQGSPGPPPTDDRLDSWKVIADYLKRGVTTVQRWEEQEGLPVHRHLHEKRGSVYAFKSELDRWWQNGRQRLEGDGLTEGPGFSAMTVETGGPGQTAASVGRLPSSSIGWAIGLLIAALAMASVTWRRILPSDPELSSRAVPLTALPGRETAPALSPDGKQVAFVWDGGNAAAPAQLYVKLIGVGDPLQLTRGPASVSDPTWSPDGGEIAFLRSSSEGSRELIVIPALGGQERKLTTTRCTQNGLSWSADGKLLALPDKESPREPDGLFLISTETGEKTRLTSAPRGATVIRGDSRPSFSPDGRTLAFLRRESYVGPDIFLVSVPEGDEPRRLVGDFQWISSLDWSADGRSLVFHGEGKSAVDGLWRVSGRGGEPESLSTELGEGAEDISIARTGTRLVYSKTIHDSNIWRVKGPSSKGQVAPTRLITSTRADRDPRYSPDGNRIAFSSDRSGEEQIWSCASDGRACRQMTTEDGGDPSWSPDGQQIAFSCGFSNKTPGVCVVSAQGGFARRITPNVDGFGPSWGPSWSRDGRWIYFTRPGGTPAVVQIWKVPAIGGEPRQITREGGISGQQSLGGGLIYFSKRPGPDTMPIWRVSEYGGEEALVLDKRPHWKNWTLWRESIVYVNPEGETGPTIELFDLGSRTVTEIAALGPDTEPDIGLSVSPDGQWIIYSRDDLAGSDLMLIEGFQ